MSAGPYRAFCGACGATASRPPTPVCLSCGASMTTEAGSETSFGVTTHLALQEAREAVLASLASLGAQATVVSDRMLGGSVTVQKRPNFWLAVVLLFLCIIPGIVYLVVTWGTESHPFTIQLADDEEGTRVSWF